MAFCLMICLFHTGSANAQEPKLLGTFGDWATYKINEAGNDVCYMVSKPKKAQGNYTKRGDIFALVTHRPGKDKKNVFSYMTGYTYKPESDVRLTIDGREFILFTENDMAWAPDDMMDNRLAKAIQDGSTMVVKGTSSRGTLTTDTFSLKGSTKAHEKISSACNI
jgi:hypothetical protein